jgi:L-Ala-D/L-Glu epimerase / N-acetyl-D-glutamate racemase
VKAIFSHISWPLKQTFTISRGSKNSAEVIHVELYQGDTVMGQGEAVPYAHYGESVAGCLEQLENIRTQIESGLTRQELLTLLPVGAARNALDCALWDYEAKTNKTTVWQLAQLKEPTTLTTAYTISYDTPAKMGENAKKNAHRPLLKLKLARREDLPCIEAVFTNAPQSRIIVDANEGWSIDDLEFLTPQLQKYNVELIEQPLPANNDAELKGYTSSIPLCADESCRHIEGLEELSKKYQYINIKLDKTGGLTHAIDYVEQAPKYGLKIMIGCMVGSSLAMAPAMLLGHYADYVDLDGPLLLAKDHDNSIQINDSTLSPASPELWG